jgi:hypothetical protein
MSYLLALTVAIPLYLIMRSQNFGRLSSQIVAGGSPFLALVSVYAWTAAHPLAGIMVFALLGATIVTILFIVISAEIDD